MKMWLFLLVIAQSLYRTKFDTFLNNVDDWNKNDWYSLEWCTTVLLIQSFDSWGSFSDLKCWHFLYYTIELLISWVAGGSLNPTVGFFFFYTSLKWTSITFRKNGSAHRFIMLSGWPVPPFHPPPHLSIFGLKGRTRWASAQIKVM